MYLIKMSEKELLMLRINPIKSALLQVSKNIRICLNNKINSDIDSDDFEKFQLQHKILTQNFHKIINDLIPFC